MSDLQVSGHPYVRRMTVTSYGGIDDPEIGRNLTGSFHVSRFTYHDGGVHSFAVDIGGHQGFGVNLEINNQIEMVPDGVFITHGHMDHVGRLPILWKHPDFKGKIYMSHLTKSVSALALTDAAKQLGQQYELAYRRYCNLVSKLKSAWKTKVENDPSFHAKKGKKTVRNSSGNRMAKTVTPDVLEEIKLTLAEANTILSECGIKKQSDLVKYLEERKPQAPAFSCTDVEEMMEHVVIVPDGQFVEVLPGVKIRTYNAGHVLGSKSVLFQVQKGARKKEYAYFSGDVGSYRWPTKPAGGIEVPGKEFPLSFAMVESTYGGIIREDFAEGMRKMEGDLAHAMRKKQASVFACFSLDRAQRVLHELMLLQAKNGWNFPIYLDSPLAAAYTQLYAQYAADPLFRKSMENVVCIIDDMDRKARMKESGFRVFVTSAGMAEGGPIISYLSRWIGNPMVEFSFPGYMAEGTNGWKLAVRGDALISLPVVSRLNDEESIECETGVVMKEFEVRAKINHYTHFSGHKDEKDSTRWYGSLTRALNMTLSIVHGERTRTSMKLRNTLKRKGFDDSNMVIPKLEEEIIVFG